MPPIRKSRSFIGVGLRANPRGLHGYAVLHAFVNTSKQKTYCLAQSVSMQHWYHTTADTAMELLAGIGSSIVDTRARWYDFEPLPSWKLDTTKYSEDSCEFLMNIITMCFQGPYCIPLSNCSLLERHKYLLTSLIQVGMGCTKYADVHRSASNPSTHPRYPLRIFQYMGHIMAVHVRYSTTHGIDRLVVKTEFVSRVKNEKQENPRNKKSQVELHQIRLDEASAELRKLKYSTNWGEIEALQVPRYDFPVHGCTQIREQCKHLNIEQIYSHQLMERISGRAYADITAQAIAASMHMKMATENHKYMVKAEGDNSKEVYTCDHPRVWCQSALDESDKLLNQIFIGSE
jgi:hypothetical protein